MTHFPSYDEELFRGRGAPDRMARGYKACYDEMVAKGIADTGGPRHRPPPRV